MNNTEYRLQILSHEEIFASRVDAVDYVNDYFKPESLIGEPVVCFYGEAKKPSVLMAVGVGNRKIAFIDIDEVKEKVAELEETVEHNSEEVEKVSKAFMDIVNACGLVYDENKIENQITYVPDRKDTLINETTSLSEAVAVISKYVQENFAATKFVVEDTKSIKLNYIKNEEGDGNILRAAVRISSYGDSDDDAFNNNIIGIKNDGLYATSNLTYDEETRRLTFTSSGMKNGKFMDDANKQVINLGEHTSFKADNDGHDISVSVKEVSEDKYIVSADAKLSDDVDNILVSRDGKLFVDGRAKNIKYKSGTVFKGLSDLENSVDSINDKVAELERNSVITGDESDTMVIKANKTSNGYAFTGDVRLSSDNSIVVANGGLKADIEITSDLAANKLKVRVGNAVKEVELPGVNIIKEVKYNPSTKAIYIVLNDGSSMTIPVGDMLKTWVVNNPSTSPVVLTKTEAGNLEELSATLKLASTDNILKVDESGQLVAPKSVITNAVDAETSRALTAETEIKAALKEEVSKREETYAELESKVLNNEKSVNELIAKDNAVDAALAAAVEQFNQKLAVETERAMLAEKKNADAIEILNSDADVPGSVEHIVSHAVADVKNLVNVEKDRAVAVEEGLEDRIVSLESKLGTDTTSVLDMAKAYTDVETERAKTAEGVLEDKIELAATYTYVDGKLALKADQASVEESLLKKADVSAMNEALALKADKVETDYKLGLKADASNVYTKEESDSKFLTEHQDLSHLATKEELATKVDNKDFEYRIEKKANVGDSYLKSEADEKFLTQHQDISHLATKEELKSESERAITKETEIEAAYKAADDALQLAINGKVAEVKLEKGDSDLVYHLFVDGVKSGTINIPEDQFLKEVSYDNANGELVFVFSTSEGFNTVRVDVKTLIDIYTAGDGLSVSDNEFSLKLSVADEGFLFVDKNGLKTVGIKEALAAKANVGVSYTKAETEALLDNKANVGVSYTKDEADSKFLTEHQDLSHLALNTDLKSESDRAIAKETEIEAAYKDADAVLQANIDAKVADVKLQKGDTDLVYHLFVDGVNAGSINIPEDQFLKSASYDAGNRRLVFVFKTESGDMTEYVDVADLVDTYTAGNGLSLSDNKFSLKIDSASESYLSVSENGIKVSGIDAALTNKANVGDSYTKAEADAKFLTEQQDISGLATKEELSNAVASLNIKDSEIEAAYKAADEALKNSVDTKVDDVKLVKGDTDLVYHLMVDGVNAGSINIPEDQFLKEASYDAGNKQLVFVFKTENGEMTERVNVSDLVDTYTAGNGLSMSDNKFSIKVSPASESYLTVDEEGLKVNGIDTKLSEKANVGDSYTKSESDAALANKANVGDSYLKTEADEKFLTEHQDLSHLATKEELATKVEIKDFEYALEKKANVGVSYTKEESDSKFLTEHQDISMLASKEELSAAEQNLQAQIDGKVADVKLEKGDTDLVYHLFVDGEKAGSINIPQDQFLSEVSYDSANGELVFVFNTSDGYKTVKVAVGDLVDTYTAGNGLKLENNQFSITVSPASESYLTVDANGIKLSGIDAALANKANVGDSYLKAESDNMLAAKANVGDSYLKAEADAKFLTEHQDLSNLTSKEELKAEADRAIAKEAEIEAAYKAADVALQTNIDAKVSNVKLEKGDTDLVYHLMVDGVNAGDINIPEDQFLKSASYDAGNKQLVFVFKTEGGEMTERVDVADLVDTYTSGNGLSMTDNKFSVVINPASESYISVDANGIKLSGIDAALANKANVGDSYLKSENDAAMALKADSANVYTKQEADNKFLVEHQDISMLATKNELAQVESSYKAADEALKIAIDSKVSDVKIEKGDTDLVYHLFVDGEKAGSINIPEDQFISDVSYDAANGELVFIFKTSEGEKTVKVAIGDLVDTYSAGNGLKLENNHFSLKISDGDEGFIAVSENGLKTVGIKEALAAKANVGESYTKVEVDNIIASKADNGVSYTKAESDEKFLAKVDADAAYAKISEVNTVINDVKSIATDLASLDSEVEGLKFNVANSETLNLSMNVSNGAKEIVGKVNISNVEGNVIKSDASGIFAKVSLDYNRATNVITFNNGNGVQNIQLSDHSLVSDGYYDANNKQIVLVVVKDGGVSENIMIPVGDLVNTFEVKNDDNNPVRLEKSSVNGVDTLSAYIRVSNVESNLISTNNGTLYASKDAKDHTAVWTDGSAVTVQEAILKLGKEISEVEFPEEIANEFEIMKGTVEDIVNRISILEGKMEDVITRLTDIQTTIDNMIDFGTY